MQKERDIATKPNEFVSDFASRFLRALSRIKQKRPRSSSSTIFLRARSIKRAADASMALAVGASRVWSRFILRKALKARAARARPRSHVIEERKMRKKQEVAIPPKCAASSQADRLRQLIPGGESMDFCSLLDETAHYVQCLSTQVQVMQHIVDSLSI